MSYFLYGLVLISAFLAGCGKHKIEKAEPPQVTAIITLTSPLENSVYRYGDTVRVQGTATANGPLHGYEVIIRRPNESTNLYLQHFHGHNDSLFIQEEWKNTLTTAANLEVEVRVVVDHQGNTQNKKVNFSTL